MELGFSESKAAGPRRLAHALRKLACEILHNGRLQIVLSKGLPGFKLLCGGGFLRLWGICIYIYCTSHPTQPKTSKMFIMFQKNNINLLLPFSLFQVWRARSGTETKQMNRITFKPVGMNGGNVTSVARTPRPLKPPSSPTKSSKKMASRWRSFPGMFRLASSRANDCLHDVEVFGGGLFSRISGFLWQPAGLSLLAVLYHFYWKARARVQLLILILLTN